MTRDNDISLAPLIRWPLKKLAKRMGTEIPYTVTQVVNAVFKEPRPERIANRKTANGWEMVYVFPPAIAYRDFEAKKEHFETATGCQVAIERQGKTAVLQVFSEDLGTKYPLDYPPDNPEYLLPIPLGVTYEGPFIIDLQKAPHIFLTGPTGVGKSGLTRLIAACLQVLRPDTVFLIAIDYGMVDYFWLENHGLVVTDQAEAHKVFGLLNTEMNRRLQLLKRFRKTHVKDLPPDAGFIPFVVVLIDEFAEMDESSLELVRRLAAIGRKTGIHMVSATQRFSSTMCKGAGDIKVNFPVRISGSCDAVNSRMILGDDCSLAADIPCLPGRMVYRKGGEKPVILQTYLLEADQAERLVKQIPYREKVFDFDQSPRMLPAR